jgi:predicted RNA-binding Zn ribbon-like protein
VKSSLQVTIESHLFRPRDFIGGDPALDFINTVTARDQLPRDWLDSYARLLEWAAFVELLPKNALRTLAQKARREPASALKALGRAKALREALFGMLVAIIERKAVPKPSLDLLKRYWIAGVRAHDLRLVKGRVVVKLQAAAGELDLIASLVAYRMVQVILPLPIDRLRICKGSGCAWLFIDTSKAGRRRWCDMAVCGNTAKTRRFRAARSTQIS